MKKMIAALLAGLFAAVTASSVVIASEPKKDDMKKTEKTRGDEKGQVRQPPAQGNGHHGEHDFFQQGNPVAGG